MSKFNVGDKVYLEGKISEYDKSDNTYCVDYSDYRKFTHAACWVKDDVLHPTDDAYNKGLNDAWKLARKIILPSHMDGYTTDEMNNIFGKNAYISAMRDFTPQEALAKVKAYEEERNVIKEGDVVKDLVGEALVLRIDDDIMYLLCRDRSCGEYNLSSRYKKTGKHFDSIDEFMKQED